MKFVEHHQICAGFLPVNLATGANNGDWVSLKGYNHVTIIFFADGGAAGEDPTLTVNQATDNAGAGSKALNFTRIDVKQGADLFAIGEFTEITQSEGNTYTEATAGEEEKLWVVSFDASELDAANGFDHIQAAVADVGDGAQIGSLLYILSGPRYAENPMPSAL